MEKISVFIVDDHKIFRDGLKMLLARFPFIEIAGEASDGAEFLESIKTGLPDIVFMDISMPGISGLETARIATRSHKSLKIIILTTFLEEEYLEQMVLAGVEGYMLKNSELDEFEKAIKRVHYGGNYFSAEIVAMLLGNMGRFKKQNSVNDDLNDLTSREKEILDLICKGMNNEEIANAAYVSVKTVEKYKSSLFQKTNTHNTVNLVIYAFKNHLIEY